MSKESIPKEIKEKILDEYEHRGQNNLRSQVGSITFTLPSRILINAYPQVLIDMPDYPHHLHLEINNAGLLVYRHTTPGTKTRVVSIDLKPIAFDWEESFISLSWGKDNLRTKIQPHGQTEPLYIQHGTEISERQMRVTKDGLVFSLNATDSSFHFHQEGEYKLKPFAFDYWGNSREYLEILLTGESDHGYLFESALCNLLLVSLVTGFETYLKTRFIELYQEGITLDSEALVKRFSKKDERENDAELLTSDDALINYVNKKINFQNYEHIKEAYKAYGISVYECVDSNIIANVKKTISYRHKIIHYSISLSMLNIGDYKSEPVLPKKGLIETYIKDFNTFVEKLHSSSLKQ